jgi:putative phage-type endonuclease
MKIDPRVQRLLEKPQLKQLSAEWFKMRPNLITASSAASLLRRDSKTCDSYIKEYGLDEIFDKNNRCCNPYSSKTQYFLDKCRGSTFKGNIATYWGQKYEPVVSDIYSNINNTEILEFGLLVHDTINFIAASPDGITTDGIMVEIKCPYRRKITGVPPLYYWIQVQLQLEVCDLEFCDFAEFSFVEFATEEEWLDNDTITKVFLHRGLLIQLELEDENSVCDPAHNKYFYPHKLLLDNQAKLLEWRDYIIEDIKNDKTHKFQRGYTPKLSTVYWKVDETSIVRIKRDKEWFANVKPVFEKEWRKIAFYKKGDNYKLLIPDRAKNVDGSTLHLDITEDPECCLTEDEVEALI